MKGVDENGEFVRWLSCIDINFETVTLKGTREFGLLSEYEKLKPRKWRPFNDMEICDNYIIKRGINEQGKKLAVREIAWYKEIQKYGFKNIPEIFSYEPLKMERILGKNLYELDNLTLIEKEKVLFDTIKALKELHSITDVRPCDIESVKDAYIDKTFDRLKQLKDLVPFSSDETVTINGRKCVNVLLNRSIIEKYINLLTPDSFCLIHGDCTFSNLMLSDNGKVVLIDPRGYFGKTELFGDELYDWSKLYYSIVGNYDKFNLKKFRLDLDDSCVTLKIESSGWENLEESFFTFIGSDDTQRKAIKLIHAIIWLSLTTYAWEDYDSICGAFYNGLYYLQEVLDELEDKND